MAITKERLEELIEKGATIYSTHDDYKEIKLNNDFKVEEVWCLGECLVSKSLVFSLFGISLIFLFETKEDAEEYAEFGNITRMERLELPSWEEFNKVSSFAFESKDRIMMEIAIWFNSQNDDIKTIKITNLNDWNICCFEEPLTRENYDEARRLCIKLFKGEK